MKQAYSTIMQRSVLLWAAAGLVMSFNLFAALQPETGLLYWALAASGLMAVGGIGFGLWVGVTLARAGEGPR